LSSDSSKNHPAWRLLEPVANNALLDTGAALVFVVADDNQKTLLSSAEAFEPLRLGGHQFLAAT